ncbi:recombinase family protein [Bacillus atrophaeus]|uniref:recombinase family protein n=1 Tax=Bacillus atrophaeus TaxID=1452 RepID=UPI00398A79D5
MYARVSTTDQANKGFSIDSQIERCKERAIKKFGYKESEIIVLVELGGMGDDPNRPALNHALYLLERGLGKKFIVLHPDRLTRDNTLQGVVSRRIWGMGVDIEFIEYEVNPHDPESMLMFNIQGSIAQYNKAKIHANSKRGRIAKAKKGELPSFKSLYGYKFNTKTDLPEYHEDEKEILLEMKDMLINEIEL